MYVPTAQPEQAPLVPEKPALHVQPVIVAPVPEAYELLGQLEHTAAAAAEYVPTPHRVHVLCALVENFPASQFVHCAVPDDALNFPAVHAENGPPIGPVYPMSGKHTLVVALPSGEVEPGGQFMQVDSTLAPVDVEYFPAPQFVHTVATLAPVDVEYLPAAHPTHVVSMVAPVEFKNFPAPQSMHTSATIAPVDCDHFPAPQLMQAVVTLTPLTNEYFPCEHTKHANSVLAPVEIENFPASQFVHTVSTLAPVAIEYFPAPHLVQCPLPVTDLYVPAVHAEKMPPFGPVYPAFAMQAVIAVLNDGEIEFGKQDVHAVAPNSLHVLIGHTAIVPPAGPLYPALATHAMLPDTEYEFAWQDRHTKSLSAPTSVAYLPAGHRSQTLP